MERVKALIVGGGASGLLCAAKIDGSAVVLEKNDRVGKKLSATGNGQGNISNTDMSGEHFFSSSADARQRIDALLCRYHDAQTLGFLREKGGVLISDERGRIYPAGKQASAVTDLLRYTLAAQGKRVITSCTVKSVRKSGDGFIVTADSGGGEIRIFAQSVVLAFGGKAAKSFGTDGSSYSLATAFSHTLTPLYPSLVQLKTDTEHIKGLKGVRVFCGVTATAGGREIARESGDLIFTDYGVSGDAIFRLSAKVADKTEGGVTLHFDLLPSLSAEEICSALRVRAAMKAFPDAERLSGILPNALGRAVLRRVKNGGEREIAAAVKDFTLTLTGTLGYDYAQVTKGGVRLDELDECMQSRLCPGLYIVGEAVDVDGECGGYNLTWAFVSACAAAESINGL